MYSFPWFPCVPHVPSSAFPGMLSLGYSAPTQDAPAPHTPTLTAVRPYTPTCRTLTSRRTPEEPWIREKEGSKHDIKTYLNELLCDFKTTNTKGLSSYLSYSRHVRLLGFFPSPSFHPSSPSLHPPFILPCILNTKLHTNHLHTEAK